MDMKNDETSMPSFSYNSLSNCALRQAPFPYHSNSAMVKPGPRQRKVKALCMWYDVNDEAECILREDVPHGYINISKYVATIARPEPVDGMLALNLATYTALLQK